MLISCWSLKGGSGTTVVAAGLAILLGGRCDRGALAVDLAGDLPAALGLGDDARPGVADWLASGAAVAPDGWGRLERRASAGVGVVPRGRGPLPGGERAEVLAGVLAANGRPVVVDCGVLAWDRSCAVAPVPAGGDAARGRCDNAAGEVLAAAATHSWLVTRPCYLALRRCRELPLCPSGVVVVHEPGRALRAVDIEQTVRAPVIAQVPYDAAIARAVDRGDLATALPRGFVRALASAA